MENEGKSMTILGILLIVGGVLLLALVVSSLLSQGKPGASASSTGTAI